MRQIKAMGQSVARLGIALFGLPMFVWLVANFSIVVTAPMMIKGSRWLPDLARRLAGVPIEGVYWPPPPPPTPDEDGLYKVGDTLVKKPSWWHEFDRLLDWATDDPGTRRDLNWLVANPVVGGVLAGAAPGLAGLGVWLFFTPWWPWAAVCVLAGFVAAPWLVRVHDRWSFVMLRAKHDGVMFRFWARVRRRIKLLWFVTAHTLLASGTLTVSTVFFVLGVPTHIWGLWVFLWPPMVMTVRAVTEFRRRMIREWTGTVIASPYMPTPVAPPPRPDGMYRYGSQLYKTPTALLRAARYSWVMKDPATWRDYASCAVDSVFGLVAVPMALFAPSWTLRLQARISRLLLAPTVNAVLAQRVRQLTETRADATDAQAAELRRIERDLHDGAQARLVAMGLHLGAVERLIDQDPQAAKSLVAKTKAASAEALTELRDLVRGIHPPVLAERGLTDALRALALDSPLQVTVHGEVNGRVASPVESAVYFAVNELLTNVAKHASASRVIVHIRHVADVLEVSVIDDGQGGACADRGTGLRGLHRRLATFDGTFELTSPVGGPTIATLKIPAGR
ncbi:sensor histidine kinase [Kibdelosporangium persicum]|uniref:histidine kinase n=1 Tax=Kibdelosporangium persicum TaxID=2698649 RepID=A0ABX2FIJ3_9PSEU|nr:histidine kinase [Kibdelosporangium persicum]NRN70934.1 Signal transduction histidine kinase [Kibdelosporangium persicum]